MSTSPRIAAVLCDWAGTTIDFGSRGPLAVFIEIFQRRGVSITEAEARGPMGSAKREHIARVLSEPRVAAAWQAAVGQPGTERDVDELYAQFLPLQREILSRHCDVIPGVPAMVETLRARGVRLGSSTGYTRTLMDVVEPLAAAQGYAAEVVITADDVPLGRPAPWANLRACEHLGVTDFSRVVVVDDTTVGVEAGRAAGMWTVGVTRTGNEVGLSAADWEALPNPQQTCLLNAARNRLLRAGAHFVLESAAELSELIEVIESRLARGDRP